MSRTARLVSGSRGGVGFTLVELLVVLVIILIILGFIAPYLVSSRRTAKRTASLAQISAMSTAIQSYMIIFRAPPGWCDDGLLATTANRDKLTGNENLVLSLLGRVNLTTNIPTVADQILANDPLLGASATLSINRKNITQGPLSNPINANLANAYGAFYAPKANELKAIKGATGDPTNTYNMPEILDVASAGTPILYFRAQPGTNRVPVHNNDPVNGYFMLDHAYNYVESAVLTNNLGDTYDQVNNSLLSSVVATNPANNLAWIVTNQRLSTVTPGTAGSANNTDDLIQGAYFIIAPGPDGVYFDRNDLGSGATELTSYADVSRFDDVMVAGGK